MYSAISIVGAGPAGASAALYLAQLGIPSLLIDKASFPRDKICGDACSGKVLWALKQLQLDPLEFVDNKTTSLPSWGVYFYGSMNNGLKVPFSMNYNPTKDSAPGFIAKRIDFDDMLLQKAINHPLVNYVDKCSIQYYKRKGSQVLFGNEKENKHFTTDLLLAADGAYSLAAKKLMKQQIKDNRNSVGLRAYMKGVEGLDNEGFIELHFLKELLPGYFWIFPMANGTANVGLGIRKDVQKKNRINVKQVFNQIINENIYLKNRFKNAEIIDDVKLHGLPLADKLPLSSDNIMLLGDAAALIDPFTGEGIGNAMISGIEAAKVIAKNIKHRTFQKEQLEAYDKQLKKRFANEFAISQSLQDLSNYPWLFNFVVNRARKSKTLRETISCMFENTDLRAQFKNPIFYLKILFGK